MRAISKSAVRNIVIFLGAIVLLLCTPGLPMIDNQLIETLLILGMCALITPFFIQAFPESAGGISGKNMMLAFLLFSALILIASFT